MTITPKPLGAMSAHAVAARFDEVADKLHNIVQGLNDDAMALRDPQAPDDRIKPPLSPREGWDIYLEVADRGDPGSVAAAEKLLLEILTEHFPKDTAQQDLGSIDRHW